ncbi:hypothetical protein DAEQUDRAFT_89957 [Daedalea quercina L-15889]|uniref:Uncharacterized protein n=1 Tax=Daedalea quercina L-15889 TaxID=1314783 RepID=A0A165KXZ2_9APHY|nr:hypothetical protein DAEQUDRAFT_89957 [Daedalea quercina L-15889]
MRTSVLSRSLSLPPSLLRLRLLHPPQRPRPIAPRAPRVALPSLRGLSCSRSTLRTLSALWHLQLIHLRLVYSYADFQISNGTGGGAQTQANAVFVDPFNGIDLSTVDDDTVEIMNTMREAAESAETDDFDPQIDAASGTEADALQVGKIKNKVLKLTGEVQVLNTKIAKAQATGDDTSDLESDLADEQQKLTTNIATNTDNAGKTSQGVA